MSLHRRFPRSHDVYMDHWHRPRSMARFLGKRRASELHQIDVDACEYCSRCKLPLALIETERYTGRPKATTVLSELARLANLPAYRVSYRVTEAGDDIADFQVQRIGVSGGRWLTPQQYAELLWSLRERHRCVREAAA